MRHHRTARLGAAAASLLLLAGACSSERSEDDGSNANTGGETPAAAVELPSDTFGDLESPCGEGDASGATDQGVTDDAITIGFGDDKGYPASPGLNQEMGDAMEALIEWCNSVGGINGRELVGNRYDPAIFDTAKVIKESCGQDFMLVGQGFGLDGNIEADRIGCKMPMVAGFAVSPQAAMAPMKFEGVPGPIDKFNASVQEMLAENYPEFKSLAFVNSDSAAVDQAEVRYTDNWKSVGADLKNCGVEVKAAGGDNYRAVVERLKQCGNEALFTFTPPSPPLFAFLDAAKVEGLDLTFANDTTWYTEATLKANVGELTEGILVGLQFQPFENADVVPAVADYLAVMESGGGETGVLGMQSTSSFLLWASAAKECGSDLTRQCMVDNLSKVTEWTGGGLHPTTNPAGNEPAKCGVLMQVKGQAFEQILPEERGEWFCSDDWRAAPESTWGVELNDDRIATTYLTDDLIMPSS